MRIDHMYVSVDTAIVEMTSTSIALNGRPYAQRQDLYKYIHDLGFESIFFKFIISL